MSYDHFQCESCAVEMHVIPIHRAKSPAVAGNVMVTDSVSLVGRWLVAMAMVGFGIQEIVYAGHVNGLELIPAWIGGHSFFACLVGLLLIAGGVSIALNFHAQWSALVLADVFGLAVLLVHGSRVGVLVVDLRERTGFLETVSIFAGCLLLAASPGLRKVGSKQWSALAIRAGELGRWLFAIAMLIFGIAHFEVPPFIAALVPAWMPWHLFWAFATGTGFILAAISIAAKRYMSLGAGALGLMFFLWIVLLHGPRIAAAYRNAAEWNSGFVALAICGFSLILADTR